MNTEKTYSISFIGLKNGEHTFEYQVDNAFFEHYAYDDFNRIQANISVLLNKKATLLEIYFKVDGVANVPCDVTNEDFDLPLSNELNLIVKFGEAFNDDHDEILILPMKEHEINLAQYIYELVVLSIPAKRVSPEAAEDEDFDEDEFDFLFEDEEEDNEMEDELEEETESESDQADIDPRWEKLKKLLTDK